MENLEEIIKHLSNNPKFAEFMNAIYLLREECIAELHNADLEQVQQIAGRILSYDQILVMTQYEQLKQRHREHII